jgi:hypothetical protein
MAAAVLRRYAIIPVNAGSGEILLDKENNSCNIAYKYSFANELYLLTKGKTNRKRRLV